MSSTIGTMDSEKGQLGTTDVEKGQEAHQALVYPEVTTHGPPIAMSPMPYGGPAQPGQAQVMYAPHGTTEPRWHWCNMITAIVACFFCPPFSLIATVFATLAYVDHKVKDFERSQRKRKLAWAFGIAGIVLGVTTSVTVLLAMTFFLL